MIMLTGGLGFLGCNLAFYLAEHGQKLLLTQHRVSRIPSFLEPYVNKNVEISPCDILDLSSIFSLLNTYPIASIIHAAAVSSQKMPLYQCLKVNVDGTINILEASRIMRIPRITFTSSQSVYPRSRERVHREDEDFPLKSPHYIAITKKIGEMICDYYGREYGLRIVTVRPSQIYGPLYTSGRNPLQIMVENSIAGKPVYLPDVDPDDGNNLIYIKDCARAIGLIHLAEEPEFDIYNLGQKYVTYGEMAGVVKKLIGDAQITLGKIKKGETKEQMHLNMDRLHREFGFEPEFSLEKGIQNYIEWLRTGEY